MSNNHLSKTIKVTCPSCAKSGQIKIEGEYVNFVSRGITALNVEQGVICEHNFIAFIDKDYNIKDSFICDYKLELPQVEMIDEEQFSISKEYDIDIVKLSLLPSLMVHVLKGIFIGKKIALISNNELISKNLLEFFINITSNTFNLELSIIEKTEFLQNKKKYSDFLVLEENIVLNDKEEVINEKDLKIERVIVQRFFAESDPEICIIIVKDEIFKIYKLVEALITFNENYDKNNLFTMKQALDFFEERYNFQMQVPYLMFLEDIAEKRFNTILFRTDKFTDFFGLF